MKTHPSSYIAALAFLALANTLLVSSASARPPRTNFVARPPDPVQQQVVATPAATAAQRNSTWTNADGQTLTHEATSVQDTTRTGTLAGPTQTTTVSGSTTYANGTTSSHDATVQKTGDGSATATGTYTLPNGDTGSFSGTTINTGPVQTTAVTGINGQTATLARTTTNADGSITVITTNADGSVIHATSVTGPNNVITTTKVITSKDGDVMTLTTTSP